MYDAQTLALVCRVRMPQRVPHGERGPGLGLGGLGASFILVLPLYCCRGAGAQGHAAVLRLLRCRCATHALPPN